jgi:hypothetical protein
VKVFSKVKIKIKTTHKNDLSLEDILSLWFFLSPRPLIKTGAKLRARSLDIAKKTEKNYTRFEWRRCKNYTRFELRRCKNYTRSEWRRCKNYTRFELRRCKNYTRFEWRRCKNYTRFEWRSQIKF